MLYPVPIQSAYLHGGDSHFVWKPPSGSSPASSPSTSASSSQAKRKRSQGGAQVLTKQKSKDQLRRIDLEHRLLATREVMKMQNEQILSDMNPGMGMGAGLTGGGGGSGGGATPISFSEAATRIVSSHAHLQRQQQHPRGFHSIVDKYIAHSQMLAAQGLGGGHGHVQTPLSGGRYQYQLQQTPGSGGGSGSGAPQTPGGALSGHRCWRSHAEAASASHLSSTVS